MDLERNYSAHAYQAMKQMNHIYSFLLTGFETTHHVLELSNKQWTTFMTEKSKWMGNVTIENGIIRPFDDSNPLLLTIFTKSVFRTQQERSYYLTMVEKQDIWDAKNAFNNEII